MPTQPGDDPKFDARMAWAHVNNEELSVVINDKKNRIAQVGILQMLKSGSKTTTELADKLGITVQSVPWHVISLKRQGFNITSRRTKGNKFYKLIPSIGMPN